MSENFRSRPYRSTVCWERMRLEIIRVWWSLPVMSTEDDPFTPQLAREFCKVVARSFVPVLGQGVRGCICSTVPHAVRRYDSETHVKEHWDLVSPAHRNVREAMDL